MKLVVLLSFLIFVNSIDAISESDTRLVHLQVATRHGVRSVLRNYPNDINQAYWDTFGLGQLLPPGMKQLQDYGVYIAKKYINFLNLTYSASRVYVRSTGFDRTLQSTEAFLSGVYQPSSFQKWTSIDGKTGFMPVPIHSNEKNIDPVLHLDAPCARLTQLKAKTRSSQEWLDQAQINKPFFDMLKNYSGLANIDQYSIYDLGDKFVIQDAVGLPMEDYLVQNSKKILEIQTNTYNFDIADVEMGKLVAGGFIGDVINNIKNKIANAASSQQQFNFYAIHDTYVAAIHKLFNPVNTTFFRPDFCSGYIFELRNDTSGNYYVQILLKNSKPSEPVTLTPINIAGCDVMCPVDKFYSLLSDKIVTDYNEACKEQPPSVYDTITSYFNTVISWFKSIF